MDAHITMAFLKSIVLSNVVKVIPANDDGTLHLQLLYNTSKNTSSDGYISSERALLVDVCSLDRLIEVRRKRNSLSIDII